VEILRLQFKAETVMVFKAKKMKNFSIPTGF